ncbi:helix-turn-helix domain-containing protein [Streptomyces sp. L7]
MSPHAVENLGLSQVALARRAGLSVSLLSKIEVEAERSPRALALPRPCHEPHPR